MGSDLKKWLVAFVAVAMVLNSPFAARAQPQVPCFFIFGDSLVDNGNNNNIASLARANYRPYGIDFPAGPTGRFSNGKTTVDVIAELLGFDDYIPPYATASGEGILKGVNYASAAAGIRDETGRQLGARISFGGQVRNYKNTVSQVVNMMGDEASAANYLSKCIYSLAMGSNDYLNNYFMPQNYPTSRQYTPAQYADVLIQQYSQQIRTLYNYGARKMVLIGVGQIGCSPNVLAQNSQDGSTCVQRINEANQMFNTRLRSLVDDLNKNLPNAKAIYVNAYGIFQDIINNPSSFGFRVTTAGCCGVGRNNGQITSPFLLFGTMGADLKKLLVAFVVVAMVLNSPFAARAQPQVPCFFIFGDSLVDNGNNNNIASLARANYRPYGIDFPNGPTGRFSNGKTTVDVIAELLGFDDYIPPYATASGEDIMKGVNYASAAAGIRDETGRQLGARISFGGQISNYKNTVSQVVNILGDEDSAANYLSKCIYSLGMGSNDYLNNYFMPQNYPTSRQYTPAQYADVLIQQYSRQIRTLYNYGARKLVLIGVGQIGCSPNSLAQNSQDGSTCVQRINEANQMFNTRLRSLVDDLNNNLPDAKAIFINAYGIFQDIISNPSSFGFSVTNAGCCGVGRNNGQITCLPFQTPCQDRDAYLFWDAFHPSEAANIIVGRRSYSAESSSDSYPVDIRRLAQL
ncbi:hypothetical protein RJ639_014615 [Escallonia herrerae]|uniref:GDSL esterase/lipase n=1 Tax=Escallonia herrerae TaxID=1293975 RepID=A0AA88VGJ3_9ASTE|nr:hypothetical protein RJ639_014615 [Escallonia herrerae]